MTYPDVGWDDIYYPNKVYLPAIVNEKPEPTAEPEIENPPTAIEQAEEPHGYQIWAKISHYWPPWGGPNCFKFVGGECMSRTASGAKWQKWTDKGCACPKEYPFGTKFRVFDKVWTCVDRGGKIVTQPNGVIWLDLMTKKPPVLYGVKVLVEVLP